MYAVAQTRALDQLDQQQVLKNMSNSAVSDRIQELERMKASFPFTSWDEQIEEYYETYAYTLKGLDVYEKEERARIQVQNRQFVNHAPSQEEIAAIQQRQLSGQPPVLSPREKIHKDMSMLLAEAASRQAMVGEADYYRSPVYLEDLPNYDKAKNILAAMLSGSRPLSIKDAYYVAEAAYGKLHLSYAEYNALVQSNGQFIRQWLMENSYDANDPEALHLGIQKFLSDTLYIHVKGEINGHAPYYYDYIDNTAYEDRRNYFVTKTLATGSGQCHTLPVLYLILAEALGAKAYLAYNPVHSFIRYRNNKGTVLNYETTIDRFLPDAFYLETLPIMARAQQHGAYINLLETQQVVASVVLDLGVSFVREHWLADHTFIKDCLKLAQAYFPGKVYINTAQHYVQRRLYAEVFQQRVQEKGITDLAYIDRYPDVMEAYKEYYNYMEKISELGIQEFPESEYRQLLDYHDQKGRFQQAQKIQAKTKKSLFIDP
jgi:hypothetical protein